MVDFRVTQVPKPVSLPFYPISNGHTNTHFKSNPAVDAYILVDDQRTKPDDDSGYLYSNTAYIRYDFFGMTPYNPLLHTGDINFIQVFVRGKSSLVPQERTAFYQIGIAPDASTKYFYAAGIPQPHHWLLSDTYQTFNYAFIKNPLTDEAWEWSELATTEIGFRSSSKSVTMTGQTTFFRPALDVHRGLECNIGLPHWKAVDDIAANGSVDFLWTQKDAVENRYDRFGLSERDPLIAVTDNITRIRMAACCHHDNVGGMTGGAYVNYGYWDSTGIFYSLNDGGEQIIDGGKVLYQGDADSDWLDCGQLLIADLPLNNPVTGLAWTFTDLASIDMGLHLWQTGGWLAQCTQLFLVVTYDWTKVPEIRTTQVYAIINYTPLPVDCYLQKPASVSGDHARNVKMLNFWSGNRTVYDLSRSGKTVVLSGTEIGGKGPGEYITGEFDGYDDMQEAWETTPALMVDDDEATCASTVIDQRTQYLDSHNINPADIKNLVTKVEIRVKCYNESMHERRNVKIRPYFYDGGYLPGDSHTLQCNDRFPTWTEWADITDDINAPEVWGADDVDKLNLKITADMHELTTHVYMVQIKVTHHPSVDACKRIECLKERAKEGSPIVLSGMHNAYVDTEWRILSIGWREISEKPLVMEYILELEKT